MTPKKILKESSKRLKKKGHLLGEEDRRKVDRLVDELKTAIGRKNRAQARKTAGQLRKALSETMPKKPYEVVLEYVISFGLAILIALTIRHFLVEPFKIPTGSMIPTFKPGDYILVNKARYGPRIPFTNIRPFGSYKPARWDIVVFTTKGIKDASQYPKNFVKRVVGLPGETIEIRDGEIFVNGEHVEKPKAMTEKIVPYGVVQQDRLGRYVLTEPPGQNGPGSNYQYAPIDAIIEIVDGKLQVNGREVFVGELLRGDNLSLELADDGKTVYGRGVYYFNAPDKQRCQYETWKYRINFLDFHFWRIPETQGREFGEPYAAGLKGETFDVPDGHYLMLGDNSGRSYDGRAWGFVPYENIKGKVFAIWMPPSRWGLPR